MNELEATRAKLKCLEMVEGTGLKWSAVVRGKTMILSVPPTFTLDSDEYEFALGIVEGKPVWKGDEVYINDVKFIAETVRAHLASATWNPPKPIAKALSAFEQAELQKERDELYDALSETIVSVKERMYIPSGFFYNAEMILSKYFKGTL